MGSARTEIEFARTSLAEARPSPVLRSRSNAASGLAFDTKAYLGDCRDLTLAEMRRHLPDDQRHAADLYEMMMDYPLRPAKALRPALCMGVCRALGGDADAALPSAAAFELIHNGFLVHDDVEDGSVSRRHGPTLHTRHGVPIAVNVGDGMLAIAFEPLLDNIRVLGLGPALRVLHLVRRMARESVEGQNLELTWIEARRWDIADREYLRMVHKKTGWYSFIAPVAAGAVAAGRASVFGAGLGRFALLLGIAFQIHDDLLSLEGEIGTVGKDPLGDLWEGKYTLPLLHTLRTVHAAEREEALAILARPRSTRDRRREAGDTDDARAALFSKITDRLPELAPAEVALLRTSLGGGTDAREERQVRRLHELVTGRSGESLAYARAIARRHAQRAERLLDVALRDVPPSVHTQFLRTLVDFVLHRAA
jgi:geranylgeranyl diphosphate synthase type II